MCGFAGMLAFGGALSADELRARVGRMTQAIAHRGPDADGLVVEGPVALGHRRLAIIDLSPGGAQPMRARADGPVVVYNGETYNFRELRRELEALGQHFTGASDTEVLLRAYDVWGEQGLARLEGIFAFALWDGARRRLLLVRDRLGVKPVYYAHTPQGLVFGSEIKAVLASGFVSAGIDSQALSEYLWFGHTGQERTLYAGVRSLEPGERLVCEGGASRIETWWRVEEWLAQGSFAGSQSDAVVAVREALDASVKRQMVADVPVGVFLSGGIDSTAIASSAMRFAEKPLASFSAGFDYDNGVNELPKAKRVAQALGLDHHELRIAGDDIEQVLISLARAHDEPFADMGNLPLYLLTRALGGQYKVVLQGDGGDELFAGYRRYAVLANLKWWQRLPRPLVRMLERVRPRLGDRVARMWDAANQPSAAQRMALLLTTETLALTPLRFFDLAARAPLAAANPFVAYEKAAHRFAGFEPVQQMLLTDLTTQLPSQFLPKVDRATMALGLEARVPLLDEQLVRLAVSLPSQWKCRGLQKKIVLRDALRGRIGNDILHAPKVGFGVPYEYWLRTKLFGLARDTVLERGFVERFGLDRVLLETTLNEHRDGVRERGWMLWKLFQLGLWNQYSAVQPNAG